MDYKNFLIAIFILYLIFSALFTFGRGKLTKDKNLILFIKIITLVAVIPVAYMIDEAMGGGKIRYILPILLSIGAVVVFRQYFSKNTSDSSSEKLPPIPSDTELTKEKISELSSQGYSLQEIHKGLDEPLGSIIKRTNKYFLAFFICLMLVIFLGLIAIIMLQLNYKN